MQKIAFSLFSFRIVTLILSITNISLFFFFLITNQYPKFAMVINIASVFILLIWVMSPIKLFNYLKKKQLDIMFLLILFFIAFFLYSYKVDVVTPGIQGDEFTIAKAGEYVLNLREFTPFVDINYGHPTPLLYLEGISTHIFGKTLFAIRLPSILFGALSIIAFYIFLRLFFNKNVSVATALMMTFSYPFVVVSRLAYEITPSLFFQILTLIFLYLSWKTKKIKFYAATGLSLGAGLYTYVGFRTFVLIIIGICIFQFLKTLKYNKKELQKFAVLFLAFFIVILPLLSYGINNADKIIARTKSLSIVGQGLPTIEVVKELQGATFRLTNLFLPTGSLTNHPNGDPNLKQNPSQVPLFDILTSLLFINGLIFLALKNKKLLLLTVVLAVSPIFNDIFSLERIPEFHYYGIGHPNTLRIAGIIPIIYFIIAFGLNEIRPLFFSIGKGIYSTALILTTSILIIINWNLYFNQPFNEYIYFYNGVKMLKVADVLNKTTAKEAYLSPTLLKDERIKYFTNKNIDIIPYDPRTVEQILSDVNSSKTIIFDPDFNEILGKAFWEKIKSQPELFQEEILVSPSNKIDAIIFNFK